MEKETVTIKILKAGPYIVKGPMKLIHPDGTEELREAASLCRCGASANKPFCDGGHAKIEFDK